MDGFTTLKNTLGYLADREQAKVVSAYEFAREAHQHMIRKSGEPYITHPVAVTQILADMGMDADVLSAGLLHDTVEDTDVTFEMVEERFGPDVRRIVEGETKVSKLAKFSERAGFTKQDEQAENLRQMLIAMTGDIRIIIVKLADRLHNMRTLEHMSAEKQKRISQETLEIFAPLAHRLGIGQVKWELEDLSFKYLYPQEYQSLVADLEASQMHTSGTVNETIAELNEGLEHDLELSRLVERFEVAGRQKHLWSIHQKMVKDSRGLEQVFDLLAIRIIFHPKPVLESEVRMSANDANTSPAQQKAKLERTLEGMQVMREKQTCYQILGLVHQMWTPIPGRFKDYLAVPKPNGYQSLHTTVIDPSGQPIEVQMRSIRMHQIAEFGVAAHWLYKQGKRMEIAGNKADWIKQLERLQNEIKDASDFIDAVKDDILSGRVFVFTPKGQTINLPKDATPIDFAYHIHTRVGDTCMGARVNGVIVPLQYQLQNGDRVEIITNKSAHPSRDWMNIAITRSARTKIRHYFRSQEREEAILEGHNLLERYLRKRQLPVRQLMRTKNLEETTSKMLGSRNPDDLYSQLHSGRLSPSAVAKVLAPDLVEAVTLPTPKPKRENLKPKVQGIYVDGQLLGGNRIAHCCQPIYGDPIVAYTTRGRGMTIHRSDCSSIGRLQQSDPSRVHLASWDEQLAGEYEVGLKVIGNDRAAFLGDISLLMGGFKKSMLRVSANVSNGGEAVVQMRISVRDQTELKVIAGALLKIDDVREVWRLQGGKTALLLKEG
jgi:GTP diphosphokinase / guanosine-3',5'-bis(diphosphate) 3'-diphosphatase